MVNSFNFLMRFYMKPFINEKAIVVGFYIVVRFYIEHLRDKPASHSGKNFLKGSLGGLSS